ncbi:ABC transporter permease [Gangjinia marincola]|uniref:ABC transporter permease n=2 Tax=Gangjinia marincola TaxID=578463 RepID=A0ABP3XVD6_9FLAO
MVYYDFTFDTFHKDGDRIYRIVSHIANSQEVYKNRGVTALLRDAAPEISGIEQTSYFHNWGVATAEAEGHNDIKRNPEGVIYTDSKYFEMFNYEWAVGHSSNILDAPNEVVLSRKRAKEYFPGLKITEIIGKHIVYNDSVTMTVRGIVENLKERTDFIFDEFVSLETARNTDSKNQVFPKDWGNTNSSSQLFIKLNENTPIKTIETQLADLAEKHTAIYFEKFGVKRSFILQPLADLHFNTDYGIFNNSGSEANKDVLLGLSFVALFLLLLGCINFVNLNTAQATSRAKEIGVRKTLGSSRKQLISQFLGETIVLTVMAAVISVILSIWLLGVFADFIPEGLTAGLWLQPQVLLFTVILVLLVAVFSGIYPSLVLSHFKPREVLSKATQLPGGNAGVRKFLTVFQFTIAQVFIIATILVGRQIYFMINKDLGFEAETTAYVVTPWNDAGYSQKEVLFNRINTIPELSLISQGGKPPASLSRSSSLVFVTRGTSEDKLDLEILNSDTSYFDTYGLQLIAGRKPLNDTIREYVINETTIEKFGYKTAENALGKELKMTDGTFPIVGVMKDFNQRSLKTGINPLAITGDIGRGEYTQFRNVHFRLPIEKENLKTAIDKIEKAFNETYPNDHFEIIFNDELVANFYRTEQRISTLLNWATGLSILISCLGLIGLVIHTTERRTKEIGIRKVLGASLTQVNILLCKEFLILVIIAFVIAAPLAYLGFSDWLQGYTYRKKISWWIFAASGIAMALIAAFVMSLRTVSTAMKNPVKSLRTE